MKIIDRYVLREHAGPLVFALSALTSLLLLNYIAKQFARLVGKGLPWSVIGEFFLLSLPFVIAMTLPMAVLVATLYAFSRLSSESEITALKASGVSMPRLMAPVILAALALSLMMVWFNDFVLPGANHRLATLQQDIARVKPTFALNEQVINPVSEGRLYLRAGRIPRGTNRMYEVVIYTLDNPNARRTIHADSGELAFAADGGDLLMTLYDGAVQELPMGERRGELQRIFFETQLIRVEDVGNQLERSTDRTHKTDREMSICEMQEEAQSSSGSFARGEATLKETLTDITRALTLGEPAPSRAPADTAEVESGESSFGLGSLYCGAMALFSRGDGDAGAAGSDTAVQDSLAAASVAARDSLSDGPQATTVPLESGTSAPSRGAADSMASPVPPRAGQSATAGAQASGGTAAGAQASGAATQPAPQRLLTAGTVASLIESSAVRLGQNQRNVRQLQVEIEKKFALAAACVVFVLFGAPLALRFPRGGVGLVLGISIVVFALYYVGLIGGESLADRGNVPPFLAMWAANIVFTVVGVLLIVRMGREASTARGGDWREWLDGLRERFVRRRSSLPASGSSA